MGKADKKSVTPFSMQENYRRFAENPIYPFSSAPFLNLETKLSSTRGR
jgi:hypothetical protein